MNKCEHKEWYTDNDLFPQSLCVDCGESKILNPLSTTELSHSKSSMYHGFWSQDFQWVAQDCT